MLRFGVRGLLGYISPLESFRLDQAVIGLFLSPTALGLYVVAVSLTNLPRFLTQSVGMVAYPDVASTSDERESRLLTRRYVGIALAVSLAVVLPLEFGADALIHFFFGSDFASATSVARILLAGTVVLGVRRVLADGARGMGYPGLGTVAEMGSWFVLIPTIVLFPSALGLNGVALALALSWCASLALLVALLARQQSIHARPASPTVIDPGNQPLA
jgi:O-antigen/teichoic acid export membrane protein